MLSNACALRSLLSYLINKFQYVLKRGYLFGKVPTQQRYTRCYTWCYTIRVV